MILSQLSLESSSSSSSSSNTGTLDRGIMHACSSCRRTHGRTYNDIQYSIARTRARHRIAASVPEPDQFGIHWNHRRIMYGASHPDMGDEEHHRGADRSHDHHLHHFLRYCRHSDNGLEARGTISALLYNSLLASLGDIDNIYARFEDIFS